MAYLTNAATSSGTHYSYTVIPPFVLAKSGIHCLKKGMVEYYPMAPMVRTLKVDGVGSGMRRPHRTDVLGLKSGKNDLSDIG